MFVEQDLRGSHTNVVKWKVTSERDESCWPCSSTRHSRTARSTPSLAPFVSPCLSLLLSPRGSPVPWQEAVELFTRDDILRSPHILPMPPQEGISTSATRGTDVTTSNTQDKLQIGLRCSYKY